MSILFFILIFGVVVVVHEFGHFLLAKANGIHVVEFAIGMGPKLFSFQKGDTRYCLRLLPIGGACIFEGQDGIYDKDKPKEEPDGLPGDCVPDEEQKGAFHKAKVGARIATVVAGPLFNFLLAYVFSLIIVGNVGSTPPVIGNVLEGYPAEEAGLQAGDEILSLNGERVHLYDEVSLFSALNTEGKDVTIVYRRDGVKHKTTITPVYEDGRYYIGFSGTGTPVVGSPLKVMKNSFYEVRYLLKYTYKSLGMLFTGKAGLKDLSGPVGVAELVDDVYQESKPAGVRAVLINMLYFAVLLSVNLGVMNLLPIPALDGGRLIFLLIELVRGKPVPPEKEGLVHMIGMILLLILMVFVFYNDIARLFR
ncbi:MAG: RIP metalloprotease RseP [Lachnospiraceae bacterium]